MFKCICMYSIGKIITAQMTINIKEDYIVLFCTVLFHFNILLNMCLQKSDFFFDVVRKLVKTVISTINMDILALAVRCYIRTHEIWNPLLWGIQCIQYILQNCIEVLQQLLSSSSQVKSQSNCPSHTIDWCIHGPRWHLNSFSAHLESTKTPYKPKSTLVYKAMIPNTIQSRQLETQWIKIHLNLNILSLFTSSYWVSSIKVN